VSAQITAYQRQTVMNGSVWSTAAPAPRGGYWRLSLPSALLKPPQILKRATKI